MDNLKLLNNVRKIDGIELNMNKHTEDIKDLSSQMDSITYLAPTTTDITILQNFIDLLPNNVNLKFPKNTYLSSKLSGAAPLLTTASLTLLPSRFLRFEP